VAAGDPIFTLYTDTADRLPAALAELDGAWVLGDVAPARRPVIIDRID
jgi:thymidine phosphorylase